MKPANNNTWRILAAVVMLALIVSLILCFFGGAWYWPVVFFVGLLVVSKFHGRALRKAKENTKPKEEE